MRLKREVRRVFKPPARRLGMMSIKKLAIAALFVGLSISVPAFAAQVQALPVNANKTPPSHKSRAGGRPVHIVRYRRLKRRTLKDRWESLSPREQQDLLENYEIWRTMSPARRRRLRRAYRLFNSLPPARRQELRDKYEKMKTLPPEERAKVMGKVERWREMTPQEKQAYRDGITRFNALPPEKQLKIRSQLRVLKSLPPRERARRREVIRRELARQGIIIPRRKTAGQTRKPAVKPVQKASR